MITQLNELGNVLNITAQQENITHVPNIEINHISSYVSDGWENLQKCKVLSISYIFLGNEFQTKSIDLTQTLEI